MSAVSARKSTVVDEADLVTRALRHDESAIRTIIQTNNRRLYRVARSVVRDDAEAEDVLQDAYLLAFRSLDRFRGASTLSTWLTRIVLNAALQRLRRPLEPATSIDPRTQVSTVIAFPLEAPNPERSMAQRQLCQLVERTIDDLPVEFRTVLMTRVVEEMSVEDTARLLGIPQATVKTRLHRARAMLRGALADQIGPLFSDVFPFDGERCDRIADAVVSRLPKQ
jgi:RNA polymerase sigma-70 factor (ECF subfamily)